LSADKSIEIRKFDDGLLRALGKASEEVVAQTGQKDAVTRRIFESYIAFRSLSTRWAELAERGFLNARHLALA